MPVFDFTKQLIKKTPEMCAGNKGKPVPNV